MSDIKRINQYETTLILPVNLSKSDFKKAIDLPIDMIQKEQGKIIHQHQEVRQLAYPIQKNEQGHYQTFEFQAPPHLIEKLERTFKRNENILRFVTIRLNKHAIAYNEEKRNPKKKTEKKAQPIQPTSPDKEAKKPTKKEKISLESTPNKQVVAPKTDEKPEGTEKKVKKAQKSTPKKEAIPPKETSPAAKETSDQAKPKKEAEVKTESASSTEKPKPTQKPVE